MIYEILQPSLQVFLKPVIDTMSKPVPNVCGPVEYNLYGTDSAGSIMQSLPEFLTWIPDNLEFDISAFRIARAGKYYVIYDACYTNTKADRNCYHEKSLITIQLNLPPLIQI